MESCAPVDLKSSVCVTNALFSPCQQAANYDWNAVTAVCKTSSEILTRWQAMQACTANSQATPDSEPEEGGPLSKAESVACMAAALFEPCHNILEGTCEKVDYLAGCYTGGVVKRSKCVKKLLPLLNKARKIKKTVKDTKETLTTTKANLINVASKINEFEAGLAQCWALTNVPQRLLCVATLAASPCEGSTNSNGVVTWRCKMTDTFNACTVEPTCSKATGDSCSKVKPCPLGIGKSSPTCENKQCVCKTGYCSLDSKTCVETPVPKTQLQKDACIISGIFAPCEKAATYDWKAPAAVCTAFPEILSRYQAMQACLSPGGGDGGVLSFAETSMCIAVAAFEPCHWDNKIGSSCEAVQALAGCNTKNPFKIKKCVQTVLPLVEKVAGGGGKVMASVAKMVF